MRRRPGYEQLNVFVRVKLKRRLEKIAKKRKQSQAQVVADLIEAAE